MYGVITPPQPVATPREHSPADSAREPVQAPTPALSLDRVDVPFGDNETGDGLREISLHVARGERVALLGPSGEGKTSLLRAIAGLASITRGTVFVNGRDVTSTAPESRGTVYLHQTPVLFPHMSVLDNVAFPLTVRGVAPAERRRTAQQILERVQLGALGERLPHALSGGQRHRVALARALAASPHVLLLDEPLSALDPILRREVRETIRELHADSPAGMLLVTHDLEDATALGDRIAVMLGRELAQVAPVATLFAQPATLAVMRFLGVHQELLGTMIEGARVHTALGTLTLPTEVAAAGHAATEVVVGIRTDALRCVPRHQEGQTSPTHAITFTGRVLNLHHRPTGSSAAVQTGDCTFDALIDRIHPPLVNDDVVVSLDMRGLIAFPR